jgi:hypothetical protein
VTVRSAATLEELRGAAREAGTHEQLLALTGEVTSPEDCAAGPESKRKRSFNSISFSAIRGL